MRDAVPEKMMMSDKNLWTLMCLMAFFAVPSLHAAEPLCEYRNLEVDAKTGDIRFITPVKTGPEDCTDSSAAQVEIDPSWRQKLPSRVRWMQSADALTLCQTSQTPLGRRMLVLPQQGCVFLQMQQACTIVTTQALSHAQLTNAVRSCVP